ncbi:MAG TPA: chalcone isomerase family protein [Candidatus Binataceae bacterium]
MAHRITTVRLSNRIGVVVTILTLIAAAILAFQVAPAQAQEHPPLPSPVAEMAPGIHPLGKGSHKLFGFKVYDASLWVVHVKWNPDEPHALDVRVLRPIPADTLINVGVDEMARLSDADSAKRAAWHSELAKVVPNLKNGDRLIALSAPNHDTYFYLNGKQTGEIDDPSFGRAFFGIWLDPRTNNPSLRKSLLNNK